MRPRVPDRCHTTSQNVHVPTLLILLGLRGQGTERENWRIGAECRPHEIRAIGRELRSQADNMLEVLEALFDRTSVVSVREELPGRVIETGITHDLGKERGSTWRLG